MRYSQYTLCEVQNNSEVRDWSSLSTSIATVDRIDQTIAFARAHDHKFLSKSQKSVQQYEKFLEYFFVTDTYLIFQFFTSFWLTASLIILNNCYWYKLLLIMLESGANTRKIFIDCVLKKLAANLVVLLSALARYYPKFLNAKFCRYLISSNNGILE